MALTLKILFVKLLRNYKWQMYYCYLENLARPVAWNLQMKTASEIWAYQPIMELVCCRIILTCWHLSLKIWPLTETCLSKYCLGQYSETSHDNCSHFQVRSILHGPCASLVEFDLMTFSLDNMMFTLKMLSGPLLGNYKRQLLHNLCEYFNLRQWYFNL